MASNQAHATAAYALPGEWQLTGPATRATNQLLSAQATYWASPCEAAAEAERLLPELADRDDLAPWLALVLAVNGRIHTLSRFDRLDPLLRFFDEHRHALRAPRSVELEIDSSFFGALVFRQPDHPRMAMFAESCEEAFENEGPAYLRLNAAYHLLLHRIWCGRLTAADGLSSRMMALRDRTDDIRARLLCHSVSAMIRRLFLDYDKCQEEIQLGMDLARDSGVHSWDSHLCMQAAMLALSRGNAEEGRQWLDTMGAAAPPEYLLDRSGYHYVQAWLHALEKRPPRAEHHAAESVRLAVQSGAIFPQAVTHMGLGQLHLDAGRLPSGLYHIAQARRVGRRMRSSKPVQFMRGLLQAQVAFKLGMHRRGLKALRHALEVGSAEHYVNYPWWRRDIMAELCAHALDAGIEPEYVQMLIRLRRLRPPEERSAEINGWYWPLQIDVLGAPRILLDGHPVQLVPRMQDLLLALACLGDGRSWISREALADRLWPDSEGDRAQQTLDTAIHRLRKQLGSEPLIMTRPGLVALDNGLCQVDYWRLLRLMEQPTLEQDEVRTLLHLAQSLCTAPSEELHRFLPADSLRHRVAARILDAADTGEFPSGTVSHWLETLVNLVPENEPAWQALIRHYGHTGAASAAETAWDRCRAALEEHAGRTPSPQTRKLLYSGQALKQPAGNYHH